ncbi:MASE1 domain-containing protein [Nocardioides sp. CGMCC 1.13656]|uniref:ATP-binding protein n=1 Tax=Nocardioides TaxID=1839 RepID=UPI0012F8D7A0|nr:ATP-binding protein [Nocardioides sp. CGMCC 1.13656]MBA2954196.1 MASE1 domain-containing protein [Nocardioides sp. CGMCC 1.13656]
MSRARVLDLAGFAAYFVLAAVLGRLTVLDGASLALLWPAAGVAAAWFAVTGWNRWLIVDGVVLLACSWLINDLTGVSTSLSLGLALGTLAQVLLFGLLISRWCPSMWGFGEEPPPGVQSLRDLGYLMAAVFLSTTVASLIGPTSILFEADGEWGGLVTWVLRNAAAVLAIFPLSLLARNTARAPRGQRGLGGLGAGGTVEAVLLALCTAGLVWMVFLVTDGLPLPFVVVVTCVWAGTRFTSWVSDIHALAVSGAVAALTVLGHGPFDEIADIGSRELTFQTYIALVVVINLVLSVGRREALLLNQRLALSEEAAAAQATTMRTILDSMADGVTVLDQDGRLVLRNPAAATLVGTPRLDDEGRLAPDPEEISALDGRSLVGEEGLLARALSGEVIEGLDLLVRNPSVPDGRMLQVTARPIIGSDPPSTVLVFHDVTADRRERDELASFAGVVAHDLLNPLTVVEGWSEALLEPARNGVSVPPHLQVEQLERIQRAAQRMQHLINDLLAYTTARDLAIKLVRVDVVAVVEDIVRARVDAARVQSGLVPRITVAPGVPAVRAEPVLLRQVLDNLVGNAVKYVAPGVVPEVSVTGRRAEGDASMVLIEVSDNGIGIPEGHRSRVFDSFHRAHRDGGYRGTGLGLSIVKRVAERHGGTAWVRGNDATGGTTMCVTFPAAD